MIEGLIILASNVLENSAIGNLLDQWEQIGVFSYLIPFLLIFALIFGILTQMKLFKENKGINGIIALAVSLMAVFQFPMVSQFFSELFPRLGIALAVVLVVIILLGLFSPKESVMTVVFFVIGVIILLTVLLKTAGALGWPLAGWWTENWTSILGVVVILIIIGIIVGGSKEEKKKWPEGVPDILQNIIGK